MTALADDLLRDAQVTMAAHAGKIGALESSAIESAAQRRVLLERTESMTDRMGKLEGIVSRVCNDLQEHRETTQKRWDDTDESVKRVREDIAALSAKISEARAVARFGRWLLGVAMGTAVFVASEWPVRIIAAVKGFRSGH